MRYRPVVLRDELRYLRREGNRRVRMQRRKRTVLRVVMVTVLVLAGAVAVAAAAGFAGHWLWTEQRLPLSRIEVRGNEQVAGGEIEVMLAPWRGRNVMTLPLNEIEERIRDHPWIGSSGAVALRWKLPGTLVVEITERRPAGLALMKGEIWLLDEAGMPIDRHGPRYARYDFPILKGIDGLAGGGSEDRTRLAEALADGVAVTKALAARGGGFFDEVSEIDVSEPGTAILRLDDEKYDLRVWTNDCLRNMDRYLALREEIHGDGSLEVAYVDLRWQDRIAVMPAAPEGPNPDNDGGK